MSSNGLYSQAPGAGGFLRFNKNPPRIYITADDPEFDEVTLQHWHDEGFVASYFSLPPTAAQEREYVDILKHLGEDLEIGESFALIAYGRAASFALHTYQKPQAHLCALVAYYPDQIPAPGTRYPPHMQLMCHLAGDQLFSPSFKSYKYAGTEPGFAEHDLDEFNKVSAGLSWSRTLNCVKKGFKMNVDLEDVRENHLVAQFVNHDTAAAMNGMVADPYVNNVPTLCGGIGKNELQRFYRDFFMPASLPSLSFQLVSRTLGVDRVVDEMFISFRHSKEVPWMLPGVPPTDKQVEVILVSIVTVRGGKLVHEHVYWDQASVLVQIGLLDPKLVPENMKARGLKRLPVVGREAARKVLDVEMVRSNDLIPKWNDTQKRLPLRNGKNPSQNAKTPTENGTTPEQNGNNAPAVDKGKAPVGKVDSPVNGAPESPVQKGKVQGIPVQIEDESESADAA